MTNCVTGKRIDIGKTCEGCQECDFLNGAMWCSFSPGRFRNVGRMKACPKDDHKLDHVDLYSQNAEFFGCATCEFVDADGCRAWCIYDPKLKRLIASWGYCPREGIEGPCRAWKQQRGAR